MESIRPFSNTWGLLYWSSHNAKGIRLNAEEPIGRAIAQEVSTWNEHNTLVLKYVKKRDSDAAYHACNRSFPGYPTRENTHHQSGKNWRGRQTKGERHDLRHEAVSRFFELGLSIPEVALISGHRDVRMLFRYTHLKPEDVGTKIGKLQLAALT